MVCSAIIMICIAVLGMGALYFILETRKHDAREKLAKKIGKLEDELQIALLEREGDIALHTTLRTRIKRLRDKSESI